MNSMDTLAKATRFSSFVAASVVALVIAGYLGLAGSALWAYNMQTDLSDGSIEPAGQPVPALVCDCHYEMPTSCATN